MSKRIVLCSECGEKNDIDSATESHTKCNGCGKQLFSEKNGKSDGFSYGWLVVVGLVLFAMSSLDSPFKKKSGNQKSLKSTEQTFLPSYITTGIVWSNGKQRVAPIRIKTTKGHQYFVRIVDGFTKSHVMEIFIEGGRQFSGRVPLGNYEIRYASGETWYGKKHLFGKNTIYHKAKKTFDFKIVGSQVRGYTIELIKQEGGNLRTQRIGANSF